MVRHDIVGGLAELAVGAAKKPFGVAGYAIGLVKGTVSAGAQVAWDAASLLRDAGPGPTGTGATTPGPPVPEDPAPGGFPSGEPTSREQAADEPQVVLREPGPPPEPPVDVVEQAIAAEEEDAPPTAANEMLADLNASPADSQGASGHTTGAPLADPAQVAEVLAQKQVGDAASDPDKG